MSENYLSHLTRKRENIKSILNNGFAYIPSPTRIWDDIFNELNLSIPDIENGMISFTEVKNDLSPTDNSYMYAQFGKYGIAVDFNWAINNGAKKVAYVKKNGKVYEALKMLIQESYPDFNYIKQQTDERSAEFIIKMISNNPNLPATFTNALYPLIISILQYIETDAHAKENEFRIRSKFRGLNGQNTSKKNQVDISIIMQNANIFSNFLRINPENVLFVFCPKEEVDLLKTDLTESGFQEIEVRGY